MRRTNTLPPPDIGLHAHTMILPPSYKCQPRLHHLGVPIIYGNQPLQRNPLKVLLRRFVHEVALQDGPALYLLGERSGTRTGQGEVVGGADAEIGEEFEVAGVETAELELGDGDAVS